MSVLQGRRRLDGTVDPAASRTSLRHFLAAYRIREVTDPVAREPSELRAYLRRRDLLVADLDLLIAATALHRDLTLLTSTAGTSPARRV